MGKIQAVVFDLYGTLIYLPRHRAFSKLFLDLGLTREETLKAKTIAMTETFDSIGDLVAKIRPKEKGDFSTYEGLIAQEVALVKPFSDTYETLSMLRDKKIEMGVISNFGTPYVEPFYTLGLKQWISLRVFSCHVGLIKPWPDIYRLMLRSLGEQPEHVLMVGDNHKNDVEGPKAVGMDALLIDRTGQTPGSITSLRDVVRYL